MIDTDKYEEMTWQTPSDELEDAVENLLAEVKRVENLLAEVKRLREENDFLREEVKSDDAEIKAIDGLLRAIGKRNEKVKDLCSTIDYIIEVGKMDRKPSGYLLSIMERVLTTEEYLEWRNEE